MMNKAIESTDAEKRERRIILHLFAKLAGILTAPQYQQHTVQQFQAEQRSIGWLWPLTWNCSPDLPSYGYHRICLSESVHATTPCS
jgi:hypothetical protein